MAELNGYEMSRAWFNWSFENPEKINPTHSAIYFFAIEHCNRLGWKDKFGFPSQMVMDAVGIKKHHTYIKYFEDLCEWGFFKLIQKSTNQYSANIISLQSALPKNGKALDKAFVKHAAKQPAKQMQSNGQSTGCIDKPLTTNQEQLTINQEPLFVADKSATIEKRCSDFMDRVAKYTDQYPKEMLRAFFDYWTETNDGGRKMKFEMQKTYSLPLRLKKWNDNETKRGYGKQGTNNQPTRKQESSRRVATTVIEAYRDQFKGGEV